MKLTQMKQNKLYFKTFKDRSIQSALLCLAQKFYPLSENQQSVLGILLLDSINFTRNLKFFVVSSRVEIRVLVLRYYGTEI